jgi:putative glutamine amidotransferase
MQPRIAIPVPTSNDLAYNERNWPAYAEAVRASGGEPVKVPLNLSPREIAEVAASCQAILLPGSPADVTPAKYGQATDPASSPADLPRENVDELLLQDAHNLYKPILAVCFGCQMLNVWRSGTLVQDLAPMPVNHSAGAAVGVAHTISVAADSLLAGILAASSLAPAALSINSSHHQAVGIAGDGLRVTARSPHDGVAEAIEGPQHPASPHFVLGVQWHPERTFSTDAASQAIFTRFLAEARAWTPRAVLTSVG